MIIFFSSLLFFQELFLWALLIQSKKSKTEKEQFIEDNIQMEYLKKYNNKKFRN